jgi:hypothetical protein
MAALNVERMRRVWIAIEYERMRQEQIGETKREQGIDWRSCADPEMPGGDATRFVVLSEETGEVARAILERGFRDDRAQRADARLDAGVEDRPLRDELVQVAAVAVAWIEAIDARSEAG